MAYDPEKEARYQAWLESQKQTQPPADDDGFSAWEMAKNIPSSAYKFGEDMVQPVLHPIDTAKSLGNLGVGLVQKAIPGEQDKEKYADAVGQFITDRYGDMDSFLNTLESDPIGVLSDVSLGVTGVGTAAKAAGLSRAGQAIADVGRAVDPVNAAINVPKAIAGKGVAKVKDPVDMYKSAAKFPTTMDIKNPGMRDRISQTALDIGAKPNQAGVAKVEQAMFDLDTRIDDLIEQSGGTLPASRAARHMDALRAELDVPAIDAASDLGKANKVAADLGDQLEKLGKTELTAKEFQTMKRKAYKKANYDVKRMKDDPAVNKARKTIARGAKEAVEELVPEVKDLNRKYGELVELIEPLTRAAGRVGNRDIGGIGAPIKIGAGATAGGVPGAILGGIAGILDTPTIKSGIAIGLNDLQKQRIGDILTSGRPINQATRQALFNLGRMQEEE